MRNSLSCDSVGGALFGCLDFFVVVYEISVSGILIVERTPRRRT